MREFLDSAASRLSESLRGDERFTLSFRGECSEFARFSAARPHQAGSVRQYEASIRLIRGRRHAALDLALTGKPDEDRLRIDRALATLREAIDAVPEDPYLHYATEVRSSEDVAPESEFDAGATIAQISSAASDVDLVGVLASGRLCAGFANSFGQSNWHERSTHHFDWSLHGDGGRAVKASYAGSAWDPQELAARIDRTREDLRALERPVRKLDPGKYRVYLAPDALAELFSLLSWSGFGLRAQRTRTTPLGHLIDGEERLHEALSVTEASASGTAPRFDDAGFERPDRTPLIDSGRLAGALVSPRSAVEYGVETNGAVPAESPLSLEVGAGRLLSEAALSELGRGLYVSNLWYTNFSDRNACRTTGMTRFATLWVEGGVPTGPVEPMRFDETLYRMLGSNLVSLTAEREFMPDGDTYFRRSLRSMRLPGALVEDFTLTL